MHIRDLAFLNLDSAAWVHVVTLAMQITQIKTHSRNLHGSWCNSRGGALDCSAPCLLADSLVINSEAEDNPTSSLLVTKQRSGQLSCSLGSSRELWAAALHNAWLLSIRLGGTLNKPEGNDQYALDSRHWQQTQRLLQTHSPKRNFRFLDGVGIAFQKRKICQF